MRLIDVDSATFPTPHRVEANAYMRGWNLCLASVLQQSAVDAVPVVRCEYCYAYRKDKELARAADLDEDQYCALLQCEMPPNGYCYYGKKKGYTEKDSGEQKRD